MKIRSANGSRPVTVGSALWVLVVALLLAASAAAAVAQAPGQQDQAAFGGVYRDLQPDQQRLFDDFIARYNRVMNAGAAPQSTYDGLPASVRTTFEAITDALGKTTLSDADGASLGTALDLVAALERVNGAILGAGGDLQFRAYVELTPDARALLERSVEFKRERDNTWYLRCRTPDDPPGRSVGGETGYGSSVRITAPSGQTVDLFFVWQQQGDYWKIVAYHVDVAFDAAGTLGWNAPAAPAALPVAEPDEELLGVIDGLLTQWLVQGSTEDLDRLIAARCYACVDLLQGGEPSRSQDEAWQRLRAAMASIAEAVAPAASLSDAIRASEPWNPDLHLMPHGNSTAYAVVAVPSHVATAFECTNRTQGLQPLDRPAQAQYGTYYAVLFHLAAGGEHVPTFMLLWARERGGWRVVSYDVLVD